LKEKFPQNEEYATQKKKKKKKKRVLAFVQIFAQKKGRGVGLYHTYTSAFHKDLDYRNWKNKNKRKRIKMNKNKHKSA